MPDDEEQSIKIHARKIALAMMADSKSGEEVAIDEGLLENPDFELELKRQMKLLGLVQVVTEEWDLDRGEGASVSAGQAELDTTRVVELLDTGGPLHDDPTLIPCPSCRQRLPQVVFSKNESSRKVQCPNCEHSVVVLDNRKGLQAGSMIAQFELLSRLGAGSFGLVWKARDTRLQRDVAIKVPRRGLLTSDQQNLFLREAKVAAAIRHPYVVAIYDTGVDRGTVYICSELIDGTTLSRWRVASCDSPRTAAAMMRKIALAIQAIHESSVIHRDLKPSNVMVDENGDPQVMDFGLAKQDVFEATMTLSGEVLGTPAYMSPEAAKGESRSSDPRTDIYSIGVMLFELLTGELPFRGDFAHLVQQILHAKPRSPVEINPAVHRELETICLKCLEKEPADRYQTALELADDLGRFEEGRPVVARPKSLSKRILRASQMRPALTLSVLTLASVLVLLIAATQYVYVAMDSNASNEVDNQVLRQLQDKKLQRKQEELAAVEDDLATKKAEARIRDSFATLESQSELASNLAAVNPMESLRLAMKAVQGLSELEEGDLKSFLSGGKAYSGEAGERQALLLTLQQAMGDALQRWVPEATMLVGEFVQSRQSQQSHVVGVLSVDANVDQENPFFVTVIDSEAVESVGHSDLGFSRYRLSAAVNRLEMNADGSLFLAFVDDESGAGSADNTRLVRRGYLGRSCAIPTEVKECSFPVWSNDVWILDSKGGVSCWSAAATRKEEVTNVLRLDLPLPVEHFVALAGDGEFAMSFADGVSVVQFDKSTNEVRRTKLAGDACRLVSLNSVTPTEESALATSRVCYWDSKTKNLVVESWKRGQLGSGRERWNIRLPAVEQVRDCFVSERGHWICANVQTSEGARWKFCSLLGPKDNTEGITLAGDPEQGIQVRPGMSDIAVASSRTVFHYKIENGIPNLLDEISDEVSSVSAFCWLGDRPMLAVGFGSEILLRHVAPNDAEDSERNLLVGKRHLDGKVLESFGESISALYSDASGECLVSLDGSGAISTWNLGDLATDVVWVHEQSGDAANASQVQVVHETKQVAMLGNEGNFSVYPSPRFLNRSKKTERRRLPSHWVAWEKSGSPQQNASDFVLQGSTLALASREGNVLVYRCDKAGLSLLADVPIQANKVLLSFDQHWLCLQQAARLSVFDLRHPREEPWEINGIDENSEVSFIGSGHCLTAIGDDRLLRVWDPVNRRGEDVELGPLSAEAPRGIHSMQESIFPMDDGRVFMLRQTDDGGYMKAGYIQMARSGNALNLVPNQTGELWAMASIPPWNAKSKFSGVAIRVGSFGRIPVPPPHSGNAWGFLESQHLDSLPSELEASKRDSVNRAVRTAMAISPDQQWLVRSSRVGFDAWQLSKQGIVPNSSQEGSSDSATQLVFSSDGKWLVSGHQSGMVRFWKIDGNNLLLSKSIEWHIHSSPIESVVIDPDSGWCFCTSADRISCIPMDFDLLVKMARERLDNFDALTSNSRSTRASR